MTDDAAPGRGAERGRDLAGASGPGAPQPDNPGTSGDWSAYEERRRVALAPLQAEYDRATGIVRDGESARPSVSEQQYDDARARALIADTNLRTTMPDFLSRTGTFEPGDLEAYQRRRVAEATDVTRAHPLTPEQHRDAFDAQQAQLSPQQRVAYWQSASNEYREVRAGEVAQADLRQRLPGPVGEISAQAYGTGIINPVNAGGRAGSAMGARARSGAPGGETRCNSCNGDIPPAPRPPHPAPQPALSTERVPVQIEADGLSGRTGGALSAAQIARDGVSARELHANYPEAGLTFHRGMRVERDPTTQRLQIHEQRPTEINGERLQNNILNFSTDRATAEGFARLPGGNAFAGSAEVVMTTRPIPRAQALDYLHRGNFDPHEIEGGQVHPNKWDMHATTRLPDVVQQIQVRDPQTGQYRPVRDGEVEWIPARRQGQ